MTALVCLTIAIICALIARVLLLIAAVNISIWWALGVFLPFGPMLFRLNYPDEARSSFMFRLATLVCFFLFLVVGPGASFSPTYERKVHQDEPSGVHQSEPGKGYASEIAKKFVSFTKSAPRIDPQSLADRRAANAREFERLAKWDQALRIQKRDLLQTDVEGNRAYNIDLEEYKAAFAAATAEKQFLATARLGK